MDIQLGLCWYKSHSIISGIVSEAPSHCSAIQTGMTTVLRLALTAFLLLALSSVHGSILIQKRSLSLEDVKDAFEAAKVC